MFRLKKDLKELSDEVLMQLLATRRSNEALTELHARYSKNVLGFFIRMLNGDQEKAQDFVQDLFLRILEKQHLFDPSKKFTTWMFTIASNMCKTSFRNPVLERIDLDDRMLSDHVMHHENDLDKASFRATLKHAIELLEDHHRMTFVLRYMEELGVKEIAEITEVSEGTVKSRLYYATRKITCSLNEFAPEDGQLFKLS